MGSAAEPHHPGVTPAVAPVGPSVLVKLVMRPMTKMLNPLVAKLAGRRHFRMAARIHHVGRRSGTRYVTPVGARIRGGMVVIPLTFGNVSDWACNVSAAGECWMQLDGAIHHGVQPRFLSAADAAPLVRAAFGPLERMSFRLIGIKQYMQLRLAD
jgi:deazaflavin-dependent oxidoreductase (nitroreductase family)